MAHPLSFPTTGTILAPLGLPTDGLLGAGLVLFLSGIGPGVVGDDGGWLITASGLFPLAQGVLYRVRDGGTLDELCYSGSVGDGKYFTSTDGVTSEFVVPPLPIGGPYDIYAETEDGLFTYTLAGVLTVIHQSFETNLYGLRGAMPPPRDVGPFDIQGEE